MCSTCPTPRETLMSLTGRKDGFGHCLDRSLRVCGVCRRAPLVTSPVVEKRKLCSKAVVLAPLEEWANDTAESLIESYAHTAEHPQLFSRERWHLSCRVVHLMEKTGQRSIAKAVALLRPLRLARGKVAEAYKRWHDTPEQERAGLAEQPPRSRQIGKYGEGLITAKQKRDLAIWVQCRQKANNCVVKAEVLMALQRFKQQNVGSEWSPGHALEAVEVAELASDPSLEGMYVAWRHWLAKEQGASGLRILTHRKVKPVRSVEAMTLTPNTVFVSYQELRSRLRHRGIVTMDNVGNLTVGRPELLWCTDEKGFNDEALNGLQVLSCASCKQANGAVSRGLRHVTVLSCVSAAGEAAPPAVVMSSKSFHPDWQILWPEAHFAYSERGSVTKLSFVELMANAFCKHIRQTLRLEGWAVLIMDSGGGQMGMHMTMEFALLMWNNDVDVYVLREYHTRALMPLDREPHRAMSRAWTAARREFCIAHGSPIASPFQALPIVRSAWLKGTTPQAILSGWKACGISPYDPNELLLGQAPDLFRNEHVAEEQMALSSKASTDVLAMPPAVALHRSKCKCGARVPAHCRFCSECGAKNEAVQLDQAIAMKTGRRTGFKRHRPADFDVEKMVADHFAGLPTATDTGALALEDASSIASDGSDSSSDSEGKPAAEAAIVAAPPYSPPVLVSAQLKTAAQVRKAFAGALIDVDDEVYKTAFIAWLPDFLRRVHKDEKHRVKAYTGKANADVPTLCKAIYDKIVKMTQPQRTRWYTKRLELMKKDES